MITDTILAHNCDIVNITKYIINFIGYFLVIY